MTDRRPLQSIDTIRDGLTAIAASIAAELMPRGKREGPLWRDASTGAGGYGDSLVLYVTGPKCGEFRYFAGGQFGDILDLYRLLHGCDLVEALRWARHRLGMSGIAPVAHQRAKPTPKQVDAEAARIELRRRRKVGKALWLSASPVLVGTPVERYLEARGVALAELAGLGWGLGSLRFHPGLEHPHTSGQFPALLALVIGPAGGVAGLHRTYLVERRGTWDRLREKPDGVAGKLLWCAIHGGCIPLWRGSRADRHGEIRAGLPYTDPAGGDDVTCCEGIEKGLALAQADTDRRVVSVVSLPNWTVVRLPAHYRTVTWAGDRMPDPDAWAAEGRRRAEADRLRPAEVHARGELRRQAALHIHAQDREGCDRLAREGRRVLVARPPPGVDDWDDALRLDRAS